MANAKCCDACGAYYIPRADELRGTVLIHDKSLIVQFIASFLEQDSATPVNYHVDLCTDCTWEALKQVMISLALEIR